MVDYIFYLLLPIPVTLLHVTETIGRKYKEEPTVGSTGDGADNPTVLLTKEWVHTIGTIHTGSAETFVIA